MSHLIKYRTDIDGLRALAVVAVVLYHLNIQFFSGGFVGVDVFFVISGYLITKLIKNEYDITNTVNFIEFYKRRLFRIYPALLFMLVASSITSIALLSPAMLKDFGGSLASTILSFSNIYFWFKTNYFDLDAKLKPLLHTWSLGVEEQFYLFWPLLMLLGLKYCRNIRLFVVFIISISFIANIYYGHFYAAQTKLQATLFFLLPFRAFEMGLGALIALTNQRIQNKHLINFIFLLGLVMIIYPIIFYSDKILFPSYNALLPVFGTGLVILFGADAGFRWIIANKVAVYIGLLSYSIYLVHWPLIVFWRYYFGAISKIDIAILLALTMTLSYISYKFIEIKFRNKNFNKGKSAYFIIGTFSVICVLLGASMYKWDGWTWRVNQYPVEKNSPSGERRIKFDAALNGSDFHKKFYGGEGYPIGGVNPADNAQVILIGDSHGKHYAEGLYKNVIESNHLVFDVHAGTSCIYLKNFTRITNELDWNLECPKAYKEALKAIERSDHGSMVVMSESWLSQFKVAAILNGVDYKNSRPATLKDVEDGILELKKKIGQRKLIVIGIVPGNNLLMYDLLSRPWADIGQIIHNDNYYYSVPSNENLEFNQRLKDLSERSAKFEFLDPHKVLCNNKNCRNFTPEGELIYSDNAHLSKAGSRYVIEKFITLYPNMFTPQKN